MSENTRNSILAIKEESTEGTPVVPSAASDFVALQDGFTLEPAFDTLENNELRSSIGKAKSITGLEKPKASFNHYVRASGVEGQAPNYSKLLKSGFGAEVIAANERATIAGSTTAVLKVGTGIGADFQRGQPVLGKDGTNGFFIRPVLSVSGDDLTLGFKAPAAPAEGVNLGKAVLYKPANSGHPSLTIWEYRGNKAAVEAISGVKVTEFSLDVKAGEMIQGSFSLEGIRYYFNPIVILAADTKLDFLDDAATRVATITAKVYRDPHELAQAIEDAMNSLGSANTFSCSYNDSGASAGKFTLTSTGTTLSLLWNTGANKANTVGDKIGFVVSADDTGALTYTSDNAQSWAAAQTPTYDNADPLVAKDNEVLIGDATSHVALKASSLSFKYSNQKADIPDIGAESGISGSIFSGREMSLDVTALLETHDADKFKRFRSNQDTSFLFNFGTKSGGNWQAGKSGMLYLPTCTISKCNLTDLEGLVALEMTLTPFVDSSGNGEAYLGFV